jgi:hypothetical protein
MRQIVRAVSLLGVILLVLALFFIAVYRPWQLNWGALEEEIVRGMAGDELVRAPTFNATRAVTIEGSPEDIWPWIVQIGYRRAGFYSHDRLDNDGIPSADRILLEFQDLSVGDTIPLSRSAGAEVRVLQPNEFMLLVVADHGDEEGLWTWAWGLYELGGERTRLVTRLRVRESFRTTLMLDAFEIIMMRKCLLGIKRRVENATPGQRPASRLKSSMKLASTQ